MYCCGHCELSIASRFKLLIVSRCPAYLLGYPIAELWYLRAELPEISANERAGILPR